MPTIAVDKYALFQALGRKYTTEEFDELCFDFGVELDEDTENETRPVVNGVQEAPQLKIEIPANRYDMLCFEGIQLMLSIFLRKVQIPQYALKAPTDGEVQTITVKKDTASIRPYISGAILRDIKFDEARYESFIALQDKLHQNLARQRTLVAIGTHDLDKIQGPFTYEALPPKDIKFAPLNQTKEMNGEELMAFYEKDKHLGRYLPIIRDSPVYPVIYDANRVVCSLPPVINGNHSKISTGTRNVFIEATATDKTKVEIVVNTIVAMFSQYTAEPFTVEPIKIISEHNHETRQVPNLTPRATQAEVDYINACTGVDLQPAEICNLLQRMCYTARPSKSDPNLIDIDVPITRADVLHQADIMEDVCIGYGFNKLPRAFPKVGGTVAQPLAINELADILRHEAAMAGWAEVMPLILCSHDENFAWLNRKDDGNTAVKLANPKTAEYQVVRTTLIPGLLKTIRENKHHSVPIKIFECSDVAFKAPELERKSRNERHFAAAWYGKTSGFEVVHGLLDRLMAMLRLRFRYDESHTTAGKMKKMVDEYWIEELEDAMFFHGHAATIHVKYGGTESKIGVLGILHPTVLEKFDLKYPVSILEVNTEVFL